MDTLLTKWLLIVVFGDFVYIFTSKPPVMFIRITKNKNGDAYYHLVESYREKGKVKQRTLLALGKAEEGKLEQLSSAISKYLDTIHVLDMAKHIDVKNAYIYGPLMVLERMMEELGINQVISGLVLKHQRLRFDIQKAVFTMICSRFIRPVSKLALYDQWIDQLYPVMVDHRKEPLHAQLSGSLARLERSPHTHGAVLRRPDDRRARGARTGPVGLGASGGLARRGRVPCRARRARRIARQIGRASCRERV